MLGKLLRLLRIEETVGLDLDDPATTLIHREIIRNKPFLESIYIDWYQSLRKLDGGLEGDRLEIGSGGGFIGEQIPGTITSDVLPLPHLDRILSGESLPFESSSLAALYMLNTLHHVADPSQLLREAARCLQPGGRVVCIEPAPTLFGRLVYTWLHHEPCDLKAGLTLERNDGPLSHSNSALPWILFVREGAHFGSTFPSLRVVKLFYHTPFSYLISGGVSFRSFVPRWSYDLVRGVEKALSPLNRWLGMFMTVVIEKSPDAI